MGVAAARAADDDEALRYALMVRAWAVRGGRPAAERKDAADEAIAAAVAAGDRYHELAASYHLGNALLTQGDLEGAARAFEVTSEFDGSLAGWASADYRASVALADGRFAEADELSDAAHELGRALGDTNDSVHTFQRWWSAQQRGDFVAAREWRRANVVTAIGGAFPGEPVLSVGEGDLDRARQELAEWGRRAGQVPGVVRYILIHFASLIAWGLGALEHLDDFPEYSERFAGELLGSDASILGAADAARGRFAAVAGRLDDAIALLEAGHALHERIGLRALHVDSGVDLAAALLRRGAAGDADRAAAILATARDLADELGMALRASEARALLG
jgi:tetratricopeptide (TPR) repeat protein